MNETTVIIPDKAFLPCYRHLLNNSADIHLLWGGRDSGKSHFIAQALVKKCMAAEQFRCILVKETYESIKDAQWQTIKDVVEDWGLEELFVFRLSPLEIECINGNKFIARGCDKPGKLKSIKDPTDAWYEEMNQITEEDFIVISTTLRSNKVKTQQWCSFNPESIGNYEDFWIFKQYLKNHYEQGVYNFTNTTEWEITADHQHEPTKIPITYTSTHTVYHHNKYCTPQRRALLEQLATTNAYYYQVFTLGRWGNKLNDNPFAYAFSREKHLGEVQRLPGVSLIASFDFNRNPITCLVAQILPGDKVRGIEQIKLKNSNIYALCDYLLLHYPRALWIVTGDASGNNSAALVQNSLTYYTVIRQKLGLSAGQFKVPKANPRIEENQQLVNTILGLCDCKFDRVKCAGLTFDFENVRMLATGKLVAMDKKSRNNPAMQADSLDCFRYLCNTFLKHMLKK